MNIVTKHHRLKIIAALTLVVCSVLFAAAVIVPSTTPTVTIGQYALKNNDLLQGKTQAYRPWFENGAWQGDIIEYDILADGTRVTDVDVGANPATAGTGGKCAFSGHLGSGCWTARATFITNGADDPTGSYWQNRNIFTNNGGQVAFTWDNLSATQREVIDKDTYDVILAANDYNITQAANDLVRNTADASDILNYIRGQRLHEKSNDTVPDSKGDLRTRYSVLGDITTTPLYIGPPRETYGQLSEFIAFTTSNANRDGRIAVGANDGMLHVFDEDDGSEVFAYVPSMVLDKLPNLAARDASYDHTYYVAGDLLSGSAYYDSAWHTVLVGGGGHGFAGLYALDMTEDIYPGSGSKLIFEKTSADGFGYIYGKPQIAPVGIDGSSSPDWYIFSGSGYSLSASHPTALKIISLDHPNDPTYTYSIPTGTTGGLSAPALLSTDIDNMVELAFAGDINGDLWMFTIDQTNPSLSTVIKVYDGSPDQPITNAPTIGEHPYQNGYMLYFGTGSILSLEDALNDGLGSGGDPAVQADYTKKQAIHGLWIDTTSTTTLTALASSPYDSSDLRTQALVETTATFDGVEESLRITPNENTLNYACSISDTTCIANQFKGWKVEFPNCGERLIGTPFLRAKRVQFLTNNPTGPANACGTRNLQGDSWVMSLDYLYGTANDTVVYNLEPDGALNDLDKVTYSSVLEAPVGINLGPGNIAQPTFARLELGVDKMYINGIFLPVPPVPTPGPILGGHLDVETDSPTNGVIATNNRSKHSEGYNIQKHDGLGRAVDGHVHDYDTMHNVDWVDLFELEPRRGQANMVTALAAQPEAQGNPPACSTTEDEKGILVGDACLEAIEGELNRAYDTLHTDQDGKPDPLKVPGDASSAVLQSEVNSLNTDATFSKAVPSTPFIITLANADLSNAGWIQIGCKAWPVVEYQNMITGKLLGSTSTAGLAADGLVFTLAGILSDDPDYCPGGSKSSITEEFAISKGLSSTPTLRIGFGQRSILDEGVHATRSQCVLGLHHYEDAVCFTDEAVLTAAEDQLAEDSHDPAYAQPSNCGLGDTPPLGYVRDPALNLHITKAPSSEGSGYRWRNGALTVQLIDATTDFNPTDYLQSAHMISGAGTHAKAYTVSGNGTNEVVEPDEDLDGSSPDDTRLLYEAVMYWHYSDLVDKIRNSDPDSNTTPKDAGCYGGAAYSGKTTIDVGGLTFGEYAKLIDPLVKECEELGVSDPDKVCDLERFAQLLDFIDGADSEPKLNQALLELAELLAQNQALADYASMREYVGDKIPEQKKLAIDQQQNDEDSTDTLSGDGTPADIETYEDTTPELAGPNSVFGRRNWIDLRQ